MLSHRLPLFALASAVLTSIALGQRPGVPIETNGPLTTNQSLLEKAGALREGGKLMKAERVTELLKNPVPAPLTLPEPNTKPLTGSEVAERARQSYVRIGWYYLCPRCDHWHVNLAGAYVISSDGGVATCHHVVQPDREMREGYLIAVDSSGEVRAVTGILAKSQTMDAAIVRLEGGALSPLPLNDQVSPGDAAFCYSDPLGQVGYLSRGIVNRFYRTGSTSAAPGSLDEAKTLRVNVSTDWAPGSSGAAVLDECGNAIGHVSTISPLSEDDASLTPPPNADGPKRSGKAKPKAAAANGRFRGATLITLHEAVTARGVMALAKAMNEAAAKPPEKPAE